MSLSQAAHRCKQGYNVVPSTLSSLYKIEDGVDARGCSQAAIEVGRLLPNVLSLLQFAFIVPR